MRSTKGLISPLCGQLARSKQSYLPVIGSFLPSKPLAHPYLSGYGAPAWSDAFVSKVKITSEMEHRCLMN